ncbi:unnamed protein product [Orchesella dallaii]|uniref:CCDC66 domain-containing protein n=1 Tax=Orchesella dallaii TaxID=48710 RepID=A0ABP1QEX6_9HEXA
MKTSRSELSLLEQKKLQWAKEREELNGLWSPWGRQQDSSNSLSPAMQTQVSYPSPTNIVTSSYVANLGIGPATYSPSPSHSECYLPPINSTIAQQPRQKAKVWNAEFQSEDYRYENDNSQHHQHPNRSALQARKASLPNYMFESGDGYHNGNYHHQEMVLQQHGKLDGGANNSNSNLRASSMDEDAFTSGYYSENNNNGDEQSGQANKDFMLKPTSRERSYQEEITVQKAISLRGEHNASPRVIVHKIYAQNGEVIAEQKDGHEVVVNSMVMSTSSGRGDGNSRLGDYNHHHYDSSRSPCGNLPRNHAMRSSLTIGVDARTVEAYNEIDRREKEQWLLELEKQREEQRMRKLMEKEERRPRWGDRGIGVGHFWEPSDSENSHLPAPPPSSRGKGGVQAASPRVCDNENGGDENYSTHHHQGQSHTPPAWLEKGLTRMQSSKSQPSLHDPEYVYDLDRVYNGTEDAGGPNNNISSSRSLNHSAIDLRNVVGYNSPTADPQSDRAFFRGHNVPIDLDTHTEMEKKRFANQEHLEALKKQIEAKQQQQKEEKERQQQEDREHEMRIARQREMELQRLEMEKRGKAGHLMGDMPNCVEENGTVENPSIDTSSEPKSSKISAMLERSNISIHDSDEQKDIEIVQRQSVMVVTATTPSTDLGEEEGKTTNTEGSDSSKSHLHHQHHLQHRLSRQDQGVMTDQSDNIYERTLTPSMQRSRSLSICRSSREFGTQTELSDGSSSSTSSGSSLRGSGKNNDMTRSHNSLLDKKKVKEKVKDEKKTEERPRWGSNPVKKQYVKQSEKDPNYISRMKRRQERLKRMEDERSVRGDTGTESEDVSIPFHRIRQRRNEPSPQRRPRGIAPMKATHLTKTEKSETILLNRCGSLQQEESLESERGRQPPRSMRSQHDHDAPYLHSNMKNSKSETQLNKQKTAEIIDKNFGSVVGVNISGTSEESSGFSTPFLARRDLGSGSTGSGTTGSGSGIQSPDLPYHTYQASKSTREEQNFARITSGRDSHAPGVTNRNEISSVNKISTSIISSEFSSSQKGFIHQREFDEIPIKPSRGTSLTEEGVATTNFNSPNTVNTDTAENTAVSRSRKPSGCASKQRNKTVSPKRKSSPVKVKKSGNEKRKREMATSITDNQSTDTIDNRVDNLNLPEIPQSPRLSSPPVPALFKKLQMGLQPDESGRISCLPTEFPDILTPLPTIPIGTLMSPNPSRLSSAASSAASRIDIDIAVTPRNNPEIIKLFEAAEERIKQRQLNAILESNNSRDHDSDSARSRTSFEADVGSISINLEPVMLYPMIDPHGVEKTEIEIPTSARLSIRSHHLEGTPRRQPPVSARDEDLAAKHGAFIASILNRKEVKEQLSARESELSEKGIIEFSIRLPSTSASGDSDHVDEYRDPLLTERRRHTAQWLYGGQNVPQKQAILTNLASLRKGIALQQQEWKVGNSDTD